MSIAIQIHVQVYDAVNENVSIPIRRWQKVTQCFRYPAFPP